MSSEKTKIYQVCGMTYTLPKLLITMGLIFLGYSSFSVCIAATPTLVTLKLKELGISSTLLVLITTTIGQIFNMTVCPWVSFKSDRYRSKRWGRRVPFILYTLPMMCVSWMILAFYREESGVLNRIIAPLAQVSPETMAIIVIAVGIIIFKFFYMFVGSVFFYIYNDVIPPQTMTRFTGGITITGSISATLYNYFIFPHALSHFKPVMIGFAAAYALLMGTVCFLLKEPRFPDPEPEEKKQGRGLAGLFSFCRECFSHRIYVYEFVETTLVSAAITSTMFTVFHEQSMGLDLGDIGGVHGTVSLCRTVMAFAAASLGAILVDRWHPVRVSVLLGAFFFLTVCYDTRWFFFDPPPMVFRWVSLFSAIFLFTTLLTGISGMPTLQMMLPKSRFGQFCSARSLVASLTGLLFGLIFGGYMDLLKYGFALGDRAYRGIYFWQVLFRGAALVFTMMKFYQYRKLGGFSAYKAPAIWEPSGREIMETAENNPPQIRLLKYVLLLVDGTLLLTVVSPAVLAYLAKAWDVAGGGIFYLTANFPAAAAMLVVWLVIRKGIVAGMETIRHGGTASIPHHGILLLATLMRLLFQGIFIMEAVMIMRVSRDGSMAAKMNLYESLLDIVFLALVWLCVKQEDPIDNSGQQEKNGVSACIPPDQE